MKRSSSRDTPPRRPKRSRGSIGRYEDSSDGSPERRRRGSRGRTPSPRRYAREGPPHREYAGYKVLCVSALHPKASDELIKDTLYREYKRFGEISIRISHDLDHERVAYVCFRSSEDARDAKHLKPRIMIYDKVAIVEPVIERPVRSIPSEMYRRPRSRSLSPEYDAYYRARSPLPSLYDRYERYMMGVQPPAPSDLRRDVPPPLHHDFMRMPLRDPYGPARHPPHLAPPPHYAPIPRGFPPHGARAPRPHFNGEGYTYESKKDRYPNYLHHVAPEDDPLATRTLFAGNLEIDISEEELRRIFERYGVVEDIDIKRPPPGTGNAFAFIRYQNLDMAHRAKTELSGQYIGKFQCKIGYGKATPTTRIWVGGLGSWTSVTQLEREFDRFGAIKKIDYVKGDTSGYIQYDSIDAAQAAVKEMRGFALGGQDHRLRIDFADVPGMPTFKPRATPAYPPPPPEGGEPFRGHAPGTADDYPYEAGSSYDSYPESEHYRGMYRGRGGKPPGYERRGYKPGHDGYGESDWPSRRAEDYDKHRRSLSGDRAGSPRMRSMDSDSGSDGVRNGHLGSSRTLADLGRRCVATWQGALILKNSLFPAKLHLTDGDPEILESLMRDEEGKPILRITQRLRLDQPKLDDVSKRIAGSSAHAIFLGLPGSSNAVTVDDAAVQTRPLRNLVTYLKQKEAAGVISLVSSKDTDVNGVLYAFPCCHFSNDLLKRAAPSLTDEALKEEHLVVVVVKGDVA